MGEWQCEQSAVTKASRMAAWSYWTNMDHHVALEPDVKKIELDGPFVAGTTGRSITSKFQQEWQLVDVVEGSRFGIRGFTPDRRGTLTFSWVFEDEDAGTRIIYRISANGPDVEQHTKVWRAFEVNAPKGLDVLIAALDELPAT